MPDIDRISKYLTGANSAVLFDELSEDYLEKIEAVDILSGIPVPVFADMGEELSNVTIALGMARVMGGDPDFPYRENYLSYIRRAFGDDFIKVIISEGAKRGGEGDYEVAAMMFRAALIMDPKSQDAMYLYGRACKDAYEIETEDEEYVGNFKAESIDVFEILTMIHPEFAMGYYFLGYGYANLGLYAKAEITWREFMRLTEDDVEAGELREEIGERLSALVDPTRIEWACNMILSGDYLNGREVLEEYVDTDYANWWPLWYNLGIAESSLGNGEKAVEAYKRALRLSPSNTDVMNELVELCEAMGDAEGAEKYRKKISIILNNIESEKLGS